MQVKSTPAFVTFTLRSKQLIDTDWNDKHKQWFEDLSTKFSQATIQACGYNINSTFGIHLVRLHCPTDSQALDLYHDIAASFLNGTSELPASITDIDLAKSRKWNHPNDMFQKYNTDSYIDIVQVYGEPYILNKYLQTIASQKKLQVEFNRTQRFVFQYKGEREQLGTITKAFCKSFEGFRMAKVKLCETYTCIDICDVPRIHTILELELTDVRCLESALNTVTSIVKQKAAQHKLEQLSWSFEDLKEQWRDCNEVIKHRGLGELYDQFKEENETEHLTYSCEDLEDEEVSVKTTSKNKRYFFALELEKFELSPDLELLKTKLHQACPYIQSIVVYYRQNNNKQYLTIQLLKDSSGLDRKWFTQSDKRGCKILEELRIGTTQLSYTEESKFFQEIQPDFAMLGDSSSLMQFKQNQFTSAQNLKSLTSKEVNAHFHAGLRQKKYRSVNDMRDKFEDDPHTLVAISRNNRALEDMVNQFVRKSYDRLPVKPVLDSLRQFIQTHPLQTQPLTDEYLHRIGMLEILNAIWKVVIQVENPKLGTIILHGVPNSGKSSIMSIINEIFICDYMVQTQGNFDIVPELKDYKFQIVLSEETNFAKLLKDTHLDNTKTFFERKGKPVEGKGKQAAWYYVGAANILASQYFPVHTLESLNKDAISTRCLIVKLDKSHDQKEKFPLNATQVADWLLRKSDPLYKTQDVEMTIVETGKKRKRSPSLDEMSIEEPPAKRRKIDFSQTPTVQESKLEVDTQISCKVDTLQSKYDQMIPMLKYYYRGKSFPYQLVHNIYTNYFREREFCYYTIKNDREDWKRQVAFNNACDLKTFFSDIAPFAIYSGAIYEKPVIAYESLKAAPAVATDLAFDLDIDDYDQFRTCGCEGKTICDTCWKEFIVPAVEIIDQVIRDHYEFKILLWTFSGGRGVHLRVFDTNAQKLTIQQREEVLNKVKEIAKKQMVIMRLDEGVTKDLKRVLRLPFSIHGGSGLVVVPFDPKQVRDFKVSEVPNLQQAASDCKKLEKYVNVLKKCFFPSVAMNMDKVVNSETYKSDDRNPFICDNEPIENSQFEDIWEKIKVGLSNFKSMLFWFQVRKGTLQHNQRLELMRLFKLRGLTEQRMVDFFQATMPSDKFTDRANNIVPLIRWVYTKYRV